MLCEASNSIGSMVSEILTHKQKSLLLHILRLLKILYRLFPILEPPNKIFKKFMIFCFVFKSVGL